MISNTRIYFGLGEIIICSKGKKFFIFRLKLSAGHNTTRTAPVPAGSRNFSPLGSYKCMQTYTICMSHSITSVHSGSLACYMLLEVIRSISWKLINFAVTNVAIREGNLKAKTDVSDWGFLV